MYTIEQAAVQMGAPGMSGGQSAYNKAVGMPAEAPTASDAPGFGAATAAPVDVAVGGAAGAVDGPVPPTGHGGTLAGTGASAMHPPSVRLVAFTRILSEQCSLSDRPERHPCWHWGKRNAAAVGKTCCLHHHTLHHRVSTSHVQ